MEHLLTFSCKTRGFCPSCHAKRLESWGEWVRETLLLDVPHRQVVFTIPKTLRIFFKFRRKLLGELCRSAVKTLTVYFEALTGEELVPGIIVAVQTFGDRINFHPHLHLLLRALCQRSPGEGQEGGPCSRPPGDDRGGAEARSLQALTRKPRGGQTKRRAGPP